MDPSTNTYILVKSVNSKTAANMAAKTLKNLRLSSYVSYKDKQGVNFNIFDVKILITRSENSVRMSKSKI